MRRPKTLGEKSEAAETQALMPGRDDLVQVALQAPGLALRGVGAGLRGDQVSSVRRRCAAIEKAASELLAEVRKLAAEVAQDGTRARLPQKAVSVDDAALMLGVGRSTMYELLETGRVRSVKVGSRRLVPVAALDDFLAEADTGGS